MNLAIVVIIIIIIHGTYIVLFKDPKSLYNIEMKKKKTGVKTKQHKTKKNMNKERGGLKEGKECDVSV